MMYHVRNVLWVCENVPKFICYVVYRYLVSGTLNLIKHEESIQVLFNQINSHLKFYITLKFKLFTLDHIRSRLISLNAHEYL